MDAAEGFSPAEALVNYVFTAVWKIWFEAIAKTKGGYYEELAALLFLELLKPIANANLLNKKTMNTIYKAVWGYEFKDVESIRGAVGETVSSITSSGSEQKGWFISRLWSQVIRTGSPKKHNIANPTYEGDPSQALLTANNS